MTAVQDKKVYKEGFLEKRQRGLHHKTDNLQFQRRYFKLTSEGLEYYKDKDKELRGSFSIDKIKIIEAMHRSVFIRKDYCFQVGDEEEVLYLASSTADGRTDWIRKLKQGFYNNSARIMHIAT
jgi:hypothetical protein